MRDHASGINDRILGLVHNVVWRVGRPGHDDALLWLRGCGGEGDEPEEDEEDCAEAEELHG